MKHSSVSDQPARFVQMFESKKPGAVLRAGKSGTSFYLGYAMDETPKFNEEF